MSAYETTRWWPGKTWSRAYEYEKGRFVVLSDEDFQAAALEKTRTVDIRLFVKGDIVLRELQHLAALEVVGDAMVLTLMRYAEEDFRASELKMARTLVEQLAGRWDPHRFADEYRKNLMRIIKAKVKGRKPKLEEREEPRRAEVIDLMERLRQSLDGSARRPAPRKRSSAPRRRSA